VLDNAPCHTAQQVLRWAAVHPRVHLLWLPKYAAHEAKPVERIWGLLKGAVAADRLEADLPTLVGHARRFCTELAPHPVKQLHAA
jgi:DDE superfamily endonuclease